MLENYKEVVEALEDSNESVISHRVNEVLRALTAFSVVVLPLTFIASLWGMNVGVPGEGDIAAFWIIVGAMVLMLVGMITFFKRRGWLERRLEPARDGGQDGDLVALVERRVEAVAEADVLAADVDVHEAAQLAVLGDAVAQPVEALVEGVERL